MKAIIETERLILRELCPADIEGFFELDSDPEVHKYIGNRPVKNKQHIVTVINNIRKQYKDNGIGRWAMIDKKSSDFIGWGGLKFVTERTNNHINYYDLGYRLKKEYWGQGFATEVALVSLKYAFEQLSATEVYAMANIENDGSNKVLKKAQLRIMSTFNFEGIEHYWYKIGKEEYESTKQSC